MQKMHWWLFLILIVDFAAALISNFPEVDENEDHHRHVGSGRMRNGR